MKNSTTILIIILFAILYRAIPERPPGFAPQIALLIFLPKFFNGNRTLSASITLLSIIISDLIYQILFLENTSIISGFYKGQLINYTLLFSLPFIVSRIKRTFIIQCIAGSII